MTSPFLARVDKGDLCAGCGLCESLSNGAIAMDYDAKGWLRPVARAPLDPGLDARLAGLCPGLGMEQRAEGREDHVLWGPLVAVRSGHATDSALRRNASSGGALSAVLAHLLDTGAADRVVQIAADAAMPYANRVVTSVSADDVFAAAGSRYAPSAPLAAIDAELARDGRIAFVGKPCDVAALRALGRVDPRVDEKVVAMLSFFCAGVPSLTGVRRVVKKLGVAEDDLAAFRFRGDGWPGHAAATARDGRVEKMSYADSWGDILSKHVQFRCKICPDGVGGFADLVCADSWECDAAGYPLFEEQDGASLIVSRTARGEAIAQAAIAAGRLRAEPFDAARIGAMQPGQLNRKRQLLSRLAAMTVAGRPRPDFTGFNLTKAARQARVSENFRSFVGTLRRLFRR